MEFRNFTPFPALAYQAIDQHNRHYHVVAMRQTFVLQVSGQLTLVDEQAPLLVADEYCGAMNRSSVKQESDLAPFKPKCDIIVVATAYAPGSVPMPSFPVRMRVLQPPSLSIAPVDPVLSSGNVVLDKTLTVTGPRYWKKRFVLPGWVLTAPEPVTSLPLRYEYAYGGALRLEDEDGRKRAVQCGEDPEAVPPLRHAVVETNPVGRGYTEGWFIKAKKLTFIPAPQIEDPQHPVQQFGVAYPAEGLGVITKVWLPRRRLCGTVDDAFAKSDTWLPDDFDFAYWRSITSGNISSDTNPPIVPETPAEQSWLEEAWDQTKSIAREYKLVERGLGVANVVWGVGEMLSGGEVMLIPSGVTQIAGAVVITHGADTASTGLMQMWTGESQKTITEQGAGPGADAVLGMLNPASIAKTAVREGTESLIKTEAKQLGKEEAEKLAREEVANVTKAVGKVENLHDAGKSAHKAGDGIRIMGEEVPVVPESGRYRGGPHSRTKEPVGDDLDSHHIPAKSVSGIPPDRGPAIQMEPSDHRLTSSHGSQGLEGAEYRAQIQDMVRQGRMRDAMATEIRDVRRAALEGSGSRKKYNQAIREMLDYAKGEGFLNK